MNLLIYGLKSISISISVTVFFFTNPGLYVHINLDSDINRTYGILQAWIKGGQPNEFPNTTRNTFGPKKCNLDTHLGRGTLFEGKSFEAMAPFRAFKWSHIAAAKVLEGGSYEETFHEKYFYWCIVGDEITNKSGI